VHPHVFRSPLSQVPEVVEYQVRQTPTGADVDVRLAGPIDADALRHRITAALAASGLAAPGVNVQVVASGERTVTGKQRRFVRVGDG
jgi:hypothetical protein